MAKRNKSDSYQYKIVEISVDPSVLSDFDVSNGLGSQLNLAKYSDQFKELRFELLKRVLEIVENDLTPRQSQVVKLRLEGKTQVQIAEELNLHQTTIYKTLSGNEQTIIHRTSDGEVKYKKRYGGAIKKLKKICSKDIIILNILGRMNEARTQDIASWWDWLGEK